LLDVAGRELLDPADVYQSGRAPKLTKIGDSPSHESPRGHVDIDDDTLLDQRVELLTLVDVSLRDEDRRQVSMKARVITRALHVEDHDRRRRKGNGQNHPDDQVPCTHAITPHSSRTSFIARATMRFILAWGKAPQCAWRWTDVVVQP
jgi:hypothetical protein